MGIFGKQTFLGCNSVVYLKSLIPNGGHLIRDRVGSISPFFLKILHSTYTFPTPKENREVDTLSSILYLE